VQRCKEYTKEPILILWHVVGYALIVDSSKKTISHNETYAVIGETPTDHDYEGSLKIKKSGRPDERTNVRFEIVGSSLLNDMFL
jgi:hypothetical protein